MKTIDTLAEKFSGGIWHPAVISLFRKCLYVFLFFHTLVLLPVAGEFWGPGSFIPHYEYVHSWLVKSLNLLETESFRNYYLFFAIAQMALIVLSFIIKPQRLLCIGIYFFSVTLHHKAAMVENSGETLAMILLFYLIFMNENKTGIMTNAVTNFAFLAAQVQVAFVYFVAGVSKLQGVHWLDGTALHYVLSTDAYSGFIGKNYLANNVLFVYTGTYLTLILQLGFPVFIWFRKTKKITLALGILIHLLIIFLMGLTDFGLIMIASYILFFKEEFAERIRNNFSLQRLKKNVA